MFEGDKAATEPLTEHRKGSLRWMSTWGKWRATVSAGAALAGAALATNLGVLSWITSFPTENGNAIVFTGNCVVSKRIILWAELAINVLSTLLLGASNACAQLLASPTRYEIDKAHARRTWVEIGVPNCTNLPRIAGWRATLWCLLFISSVPLHLVYNAVFFSTTTLNDCQVALVTEAFLSDGYWNQSRLELNAQESANDTYTYLNNTSQPGIYPFDQLQVDRWAEHPLDPWGGSFDYTRALFHSDIDAVATLGKLQTKLGTLRTRPPGECAKMYKDPLYDRSWRNMLIVTSLNLTDNVIDLRQLKPNLKITAPALYDEDHSWLCLAFSDASHTGNLSWSSGDFPACGKLSSTSSSWVIPQVRQCNSTWIRHIFSWDTGTKNETVVNLTSCNTFEAAVQYCLVDDTENPCSVRVSLALLIWVVCCNLVKFGCMITTIFFKNFDPVVTIGDAIASFLEDPDDTTAEIGTISRNDVRDAEGRFSQLHYDDTHRAHCKNSRCPCSLPWNDSGAVTGHFSDYGPKRLWLAVLERAGTVAQPFRTRTIRWMRTGNLVTWSVCVGFGSGACLTGFAFLISALYSGRTVDQSLSVLWQLGIGTLDLDNLIRSSAGSSTDSALTANAPQLILSCVYLLFNKALTNMVLAHEYNGFATRRKPLRVSRPRGGQRGTFWFQLPYRYILPLMVSMAALHWLVSRSIFLVQATVLDHNGIEDPNRAIGTCGFSPIAIITALCLGTMLTVSIIGLSFRKMKAGMPVAGSCSLAISAACHAAEQEEDVALLPVIYGAPVDQKGVKNDDGTITLRAGFSSREVDPLVDGVVYRNGFPQAQEKDD